MATWRATVQRFDEIKPIVLGEINIPSKWEGISAKHSVATATWVGSGLANTCALRSNFVVRYGAPSGLDKNSQKWSQKVNRNNLSSDTCATYQVGPEGSTILVNAGGTVSGAVDVRFSHQRR